MGIQLAVRSEGLGRVAEPPEGQQPVNENGRNRGLRHIVADEVDEPCTAAGSIIECQNQVLGEAVAVAGTPFALSYRSNRVPGYAAARTMRIPLSGGTLSPDLKRIDVRVTVAGQETRLSFDPQPDQSTSVIWDGEDAFGRPVVGAQVASVIVGHIYDAVYYPPSQSERAFAQIGNSLVEVNSLRGEISLGQAFSYPVEVRRNPQAPVSGWYLSVHHRYDARNRTLFMGTGDQRSALSAGDVVRTVAGGGAIAVTSAPVPARDAALEAPVHAMAATPDGSVFFADHAGILIKDRTNLLRRLVRCRRARRWRSPRVRTTPCITPLGDLTGSCSSGGTFTTVRIRASPPMASAPCGDAPARGAVHLLGVDPVDLAGGPIGPRVGGRRAVSPGGAGGGASLPRGRPRRPHRPVARVGRRRQPLHRVGTAWSGSGRPTGRSPSSPAAPAAARSAPTGTRRNRRRSAASPARCWWTRRGRW